MDVFDSCIRSSAPTPCTPTPVGNSLCIELEISYLREHGSPSEEYVQCGACD